MNTRPLMLLASMVVIVAAGCGGGGAATYNSPDAVFEAAKTAIKKGDYKAFVQCMTPDNINQMADSFAMMCVMTVGMAELPIPGVDAKAKEQMKGMLDAAAKHGITAEVVKKMPPMGKTQEEMEKGLKAVTATVKDKVAFVADIMASMAEKDGAGKQEAFGAATLKNLKVETDKATATMVMKRGGRETEDPIEFRKVDGSWRMVMDMKK